MKPDWKDAPDWANWLAMDADGEWHWFEFEPYSTTSNYWRRNYSSGGRHLFAGYQPWDEMLEKRP